MSNKKTFEDIVESISQNGTIQVVDQKAISAAYKTSRKAVDVEAGVDTVVVSASSDGIGLLGSNAANLNVEGYGLYHSLKYVAASELNDSMVNSTTLNLRNNISTSLAAAAKVAETETPKGSFSSTTVTIDKSTINVENAKITTLAGGAVTTANANSKKADFDYNAVIKSAAITVNGGNVNTIYGGGIGSGAYTSNVDIAVYSGKVGTIYGGGSNGATTNGNLTISVGTSDAQSSSDLTIGNIYLGGNNSEAWFDSAKVVFSGHRNLKVTGVVSGANKGGAGVTGSATVIFDNYQGDFTGTIKDFNTVVFSGDTSVKFTKNQDKSIKNADYVFAINKDTIITDSVAAASYSQNAMLEWNNSSVTFNNLSVSFDADLLKSTSSSFTVGLISNSNYKKFNSTTINTDAIAVTKVSYDDEGNEVVGLVASYQYEFVWEQDISKSKKTVAGVDKDGKKVYTYDTGLLSIKYIGNGLTLTAENASSFVATAADDEIYFNVYESEPVGVKWSYAYDSDGDLILGSDGQPQILYSSEAVTNKKAVIGGQGKYELGDGNDEATISSGVYFQSTLSAGAGNDTITVERQAYLNRTDLGAGENSLIVDGTVNGLGIKADAKSQNKVVINGRVGTLNYKRETSYVLDPTAEDEFLYEKTSKNKEAMVYAKTYSYSTDEKGKVIETLVSEVPYQINEKTKGAYVTEESIDGTSFKVSDIDLISGDNTLVLNTDTANYGNITLMGGNAAVILKKGSGNFGGKIIDMSQAKSSSLVLYNDISNVDYRASRTGINTITVAEDAAFSAEEFGLGAADSILNVDKYAKATVTVGEAFGATFYLDKNAILDLQKAGYGSTYYVDDYEGFLDASDATNLYVKNMANSGLMIGATDFIVSGKIENSVISTKNAGTNKIILQSGASFSGVDFEGTSTNVSIDMFGNTELADTRLFVAQTKIDIASEFGIAKLNNLMLSSGDDEITVYGNAEITDLNFGLGNNKITAKNANISISGDIGRYNITDWIKPTAVPTHNAKVDVRMEDTALAILAGTTLTINDLFFAGSSRISYGEGAGLQFVEGSKIELFRAQFDVQNENGLNGTDIISRSSVINIADDTSINTITASKNDPYQTGYTMYGSTLNVAEGKTAEVIKGITADELTIGGKGTVKAHVAGSDANAALALAGATVSGIVENFKALASTAEGSTVQGLVKNVSNIAGVDSALNVEGYIKNSGDLSATGTINVTGDTAFIEVGGSLNIADSEITASKITVDNIINLKSSDNDPLYPTKWSSNNTLNADVTASDVLGDSDDFDINDNLKVNGNLNVTGLLGLDAGNNNLDVSGALKVGKLSASNGDNTVHAGNIDVNNFGLGNGNNVIKADESLNIDQMTIGSGNNEISAKNIEIYYGSFGDGSNNVSASEEISASDLAFGSGSDTVTANKISYSDISMGKGANIVNVTEMMDSVSLSGSGDDIVVAKDVRNGYFNYHDGTSVNINISGTFDGSMYTTNDGVDTVVIGKVDSVSTGDITKIDLDSGINSLTVGTAGVTDAEDIFRGELKASNQLNDYYDKDDYKRGPIIDKNYVNIYGNANNALTGDDYDFKHKTTTTVIDVEGAVNEVKVTGNVKGDVTVGAQESLYSPSDDQSIGHYSGSAIYTNSRDAYNTVQLGSLNGNLTVGYAGTRYWDENGNVKDMHNDIKVAGAVVGSITAAIENTNEIIELGSFKDGTIDMKGVKTYNAVPGETPVPEDVFQDKLTIHGTVNNGTIKATAKTDITLEGEVTDGTIQLGSGNDTVVVKEAMIGNINAGDGNNRIDLQKDFFGRIATGSGNDVITTKNVTGGYGVITLGNGTNSLDVDGSVTSTYGSSGLAIGGGTGDDTIKVSGDVTGCIHLHEEDVVGYGTNDLYVGGNVYGAIDGDAGDDKINVIGDVTSDVKLFGGTNYLHAANVGGYIGADENAAANYIAIGTLDDEGKFVGGTVGEFISLGGNSDDVVFVSQVNGSVDLNGGTDTLIVDRVSGHISSGDGDKFVSVSEAVGSNVELTGNGTKTLLAGSASIDGYVITGTDNDYVHVKDVSSSVELEEGDDTLILEAGTIGYSIHLGSGADKMILNGDSTVSRFINFGEAGTACDVLDATKAVLTGSDIDPILFQNLKVMGTVKNGTFESNFDGSTITLEGATITGNSTRKVITPHSSVYKKTTVNVTGDSELTGAIYLGNTDDVINVNSKLEVKNSDPEAVDGYISMGKGNDVINVNAGLTVRDSIYMGDGDDSINVNGDNLYVGRGIGTGEGSDRIVVSKGNSVTAEHGIRFTENLYIDGTFNANIDGSYADNTLEAANDTVVSGTIGFDDGIDTLIASTLTANDILFKGNLDIKAGTSTVVTDDTTTTVLNPVQLNVNTIDSRRFAGLGTVTELAFNNVLSFNESTSTTIGTAENRTQIYLGAGEDKVQVETNGGNVILNGDLDLGEDDDYISADSGSLIVNGNIELGAGEDFLYSGTFGTTTNFIQANTISFLEDLGVAGLIKVDKLVATDNPKYGPETEVGEPTITGYGSHNLWTKDDTTIEGDVVFGKGDDKITSYDHCQLVITGDVDFGTGNDKIDTIKGPDDTGSVSANKITFGENLQLRGNVNVANGIVGNDDKNILVFYEESTVNVNGTVSLGAGDDGVAVGTMNNTTVSGAIDFGAGDDILVLEDRSTMSVIGKIPEGSTTAVGGVIDFGAGDNKLILEPSTNEPITQLEVKTQKYVGGTTGIEDVNGVIKGENLFVETSDGKIISDIDVENKLSVGYTNPKDIGGKTITHYYAGNLNVDGSVKAKEIVREDWSADYEVNESCGTIEITGNVDADIKLGKIAPSETKGDSTDLYVGRWTNGPAGIEGGTVTGDITAELTAVDFVGGTPSTPAKVSQLLIQTGDINGNVKITGEHTTAYNGQTTSTGANDYAYAQFEMEIGGNVNGDITIGGNSTFTEVDNDGVKEFKTLNKGIKVVSNNGDDAGLKLYGNSYGNIKLGSGQEIVQVAGDEPANGTSISPEAVIKSIDFGSIDYKISKDTPTAVGSTVSNVLEVVSNQDKLMVYPSRNLTVTDGIKFQNLKVSGNVTADFFGYDDANTGTVGSITHGEAEWSWFKDKGPWVQTYKKETTTEVTVDGRFEDVLTISAFPNDKASITGTISTGLGNDMVVLDGYYANDVFVDRIDFGVSGDYETGDVLDLQNQTLRTNGITFGNTAGGLVGASYGAMLTIKGYNSTLQGHITHSALGDGGTVVLNQLDDAIGEAVKNDFDSGKDYYEVTYHGNTFELRFVNEDPENHTAEISLSVTDNADWARVITGTEGSELVFREVEDVTGNIYFSGNGNTIVLDSDLEMKKIELEGKIHCQYTNVAEDGTLRPFYVAVDDSTAAVVDGLEIENTGKIVFDGTNNAIVLDNNTLTAVGIATKAGSETAFVGGTAGNKGVIKLEEGMKLEGDRTFDFIGKTVIGSKPVSVSGTGNVINLLAGNVNEVSDGTTTTYEFEEVNSKLQVNAGINLSGELTIASVVTGETDKYKGETKYAYSTVTTSSKTPRDIIGVSDNDTLTLKSTVIRNEFPVEEGEPETGAICATLNIENNISDIETLNVENGVCLYGTVTFQDMEVNGLNDNSFLSLRAENSINGKDEVRTIEGQGDVIMADKLTLNDIGVSGSPINFGEAATAEGEFDALTVNGSRGSYINGLEAKGRAYTTIEGETRVSAFDMDVNANLKVSINPMALDYADVDIAAGAELFVVDRITLSNSSLTGSVKLSETCRQEMTNVAFEGTTVHAMNKYDDGIVTLIDDGETKDFVETLDYDDVYVVGEKFVGEDCVTELNGITAISGTTKLTHGAWTLTDIAASETTAGKFDYTFTYTPENITVIGEGLDAEAIKITGGADTSITADILDSVLFVTDGGAVTFNGVLTNIQIAVAEEFGLTLTINGDDVRNDAHVENTGIIGGFGNTDTISVTGAMESGYADASGIVLTKFAAGDVLTDETGWTNDKADTTALNKMTGRITTIGKVTVEGGSLSLGGANVANEIYLNEGADMYFFEGAGINGLGLNGQTVEKVHTQVYVTKAENGEETAETVINVSDMGSTVDLSKFDLTIIGTKAEATPVTLLVGDGQSIYFGSITAEVAEMVCLKTNDASATIFIQTDNAYKFAQDANITINPIFNNSVYLSTPATGINEVTLDASYGMYTIETTTLEKRTLLNTGVAQFGYTPDASVKDPVSTLTLHSCADYVQGVTEAGKIKGDIALNDKTGLFVQAKLDAVGTKTDAPASAEADLGKAAVNLDAGITGTENYEEYVEFKKIKDLGDLYVSGGYVVNGKITNVDKIVVEDKLVVNGAISGVKELSSSNGSLTCASVNGMNAVDVVGIVDFDKQDLSVLFSGTVTNIGGELKSATFADAENDPTKSVNLKASLNSVAYDKANLSANFDDMTADFNAGTASVAFDFTATGNSGDAIKYGVTLAAKDDKVTLDGGVFTSIDACDGKDSLSIIGDTEIETVSNFETVSVSNNAVLTADIVTETVKLNSGTVKGSVTATTELEAVGACGINKIDKADKISFMDNTSCIDVLEETYTANNTTLAFKEVGILDSKVMSNVTVGASTKVTVNGAEWAWTETADGGYFRTALSDDMLKYSSNDKTLTWSKLA